MDCDAGSDAALCVDHIGGVVNAHGHSNVRRVVSVRIQHVMQRNFWL